MTKKQAVRIAKMQAVMYGGIAVINNKAFTSANGYWYLDGQKVRDIDTEVLAFVEVDEDYVNQLMTE